MDKALRHTLQQLVSLFFFSATLFLVTACGGGSGGGSGEVSPSGATATGVFLDSAVEGLSYVSGDSSGLTNAEGEFVYEVGKSVRFLIGDIVIGEALGQGLMTPVNLVDGGDTNNPTVLNIARLLQSIDEDDNVSNGIVITEQVRELARGKSINFSQSVDAFFNDGNVQIIVSELTAAMTGGARGLVSSSVAQAHLNNTISGLTSPDPAEISIGSVTISGSVSGTVSPLAQQVAGVGDSLIVVWGDMDWRVGVTVPRNGGSGDRADLSSGFTVFECATNFLGTTIGDCTGIAHNSDARTISFDDVTLIGPAVGDAVRINGTLIY